MSFEYFNSQPQPSLSFSSSQNAYFSRLLPFLDPQRSHRVASQAAIELLNRSGLPNSRIRDIWQLVNPSYKDSLQYEDVQSIIRLVAYAQSGVPISKENLELNISCNPPNFDFEGASSHVQQPSQQQGVSEQELAAFEQLWAKIEGRTNGDYIGGSTVKKLYQTEGNKQSLSKVWNLCSHTQKGYLTKGEMFVFLSLIRLAKNRRQLPAELTPEMKALISKIDAKIKQFPQQPQRAAPVNRQPPTSIEEPVRAQHEAERKQLADLGGVADNNNKFANLVDWLSRYVDESEQNNINVQTEMGKIKASQAQTFERLNNSIIKLQRVIQRQATIIQDLTRQLRSRDATDQERIRAVENIAEKNIPPQTSRAAKQPPSAPEPKKPQPTEQADSQLFQKQVQALNLLNQVRPISPEELPGFQKRIMGMPREELDEFYAQVLKQYRQQEQEQAARASTPASNSHFEPTSSNIIGNIEINPGGLNYGLDSSKVERDNFDFAANIIENLEVGEEEPKHSQAVDFF